MRLAATTALLCLAGVLSSALARDAPYSVDSASATPSNAGLATFPLTYGMGNDIVNLGINPKTAFENMRQYMGDVERAFDIMLTRLNLQRGRLVASSLANEKEEEELEYRKKIMDKLNIDFSSEKEQLKADDDKLAAVEAKLKAIREKNRLLGLASSEEEKKAQAELEQMQRQRDSLSNLEISWKNTELTINSRFQIQAAELQEVKQKISESAGELKYMKKVLQKYKVDFDTEKAILQKEDLMMQHLTEKMQLSEGELKKLNELLRKLQHDGTEAERTRLKQKYLQESTILKNKGAMEAAMKTLNEQLEKLRANKQQLQEDARLMKELNDKLHDLGLPDSEKSLGARIAAIEDRHKAAVEDLAAKFDSILSQKRSEAATLKDQADSQSRQIAALETQVNGLKDVYSDHYTHTVTSCNSPPPCTVVSACGCGSVSMAPRKHVIVALAHADVPVTIAAEAEHTSTSEAEHSEATTESP